MAILRDTQIDGSLDVAGDILVEDAELEALMAELEATTTNEGE